MTRTTSDGEGMPRAGRMTAILEALADARTLQIDELATRFGVSRATLRRDMASLEEQGLLTRTHGGAIARALAYELPVRYRDGQHREAKRAIAAAAIRRLPTGPYAVGLSGGTTTLEVARALADRSNLTVVTNAINIAAELSMRPRLKVVVTGGVARSQSYELVGPWAEQTFSHLNIGTAFVGVDGIAAAGLTTHDEVEALTNRAMITSARRVIVVADGRKVGRVMLASIAGIADVHELITDESADPVELRRIEAVGVTVTVVTTQAPARDVRPD